MTIFKLIVATFEQWTENLKFFRILLLLFSLITIKYSKHYQCQNRQDHTSNMVLCRNALQHIFGKLYEAAFCLPTQILSISTSSRSSSCMEENIKTVESPAYSLACAWSNVCTKSSINQNNRDPNLLPCWTPDMAGEHTESWLPARCPSVVWSPWFNSDSLPAHVRFRRWFL